MSSDSETNKEVPTIKEPQAPEQSHDLLDAEYAAAQERVAIEAKRKIEISRERHELEREEKDKEQQEWEEHVKDTKPHTIWLVAIDGSEESLLAAKRCFELAGTNDGIHLVHVIEKTGHLKQGKNEDSTAWGKRTKEYYEAAVYEGKLQLKRVTEMEQRMREETEKAKSIGKGDGKSLRRLFVNTSIVTADDAREELCNQITVTHANVLVVGSRGKGKIERALMGSVSTYLVQHASVPVLVTRPRREPKEHHHEHKEHEHHKHHKHHHHHHQHKHDDQGGKEKEAGENKDKDEAKKEEKGEEKKAD